MKSKVIIRMSTFASIALPMTVILLLSLHSFWALRIALLGGPLVLLLVIPGLILTRRVGMDAEQKFLLTAAQIVGALSGGVSLWGWWQFLHWESWG
jgi:hypothetical protein